MISIHREAIGKLKIENKVGYGWESYNCFDINKLADVMMRCPWSPVVWQGGRRRKANFQSAYWCALDFDDTMDLSEALDIFQDCAHVIGLTKSHQKPKHGIVADRFRVVIPFEKIIRDLSVFESNMSYLVRHHDADTACSSGAQWYHPCTAIIRAQEDGFAEEVKDRKPEKRLTQVSDSELKEIYKNKPIPNYLRLAIKTGFINGERNASWFKICAELARYGYSQKFCRRLINERQQDRRGFTTAEIDRIISQAYKYKNQISKKLVEGVEGRDTH